MKFTIAGDFASNPVLKLDGEEVKYGSLSVYACQASSFKDENGIVTNFPARHNVEFSVAEDIGNLKKNTWYRASASKEEFILQEIRPVTANDSMEPSGKSDDKMCPDCGEPMDECECDETEATVKQIQPNDTHKAEEDDSETYVNRKRKDKYLKENKDNSEALLWPNSKEAKRLIKLEIAKNIAHKDV